MRNGESGGPRDFSSGIEEGAGSQMGQTRPEAPEQESPNRNNPSTSSAHSSGGDIPRTGRKSPIRAGKRRLALLSASAGLLAAGSAIALVELIAGLTTRVPSLILAVSDSAVDSSLIPFWLRTWSIDQLGTAQKPVLFYGVLVVTLLIGAFTGIFARKRRWIGVIVFAAFAVLGGLASAANPDASAGMVAMSSTLAALVGIAVLLRLLSYLRAAPDTEEPDQALNDVNRRWFLTAASASALSALLASGAGRFLMSRRSVEDSRADVAEKLRLAAVGGGATATTAAGSATAVQDTEPALGTGTTTPPATTSATAPPRTTGGTTSPSTGVTSTSAPPAGGTRSGTTAQTTPTTRNRGASPSTTNPVPSPSTTRAGGGTTTSTPARPTTTQPPTTTTQGAPAPSRYLDGVVTEISPIITPNHDFYLIDTAISKPVVPADTWRLSVTGMVNNPYTISFDELLSMGLVEEAVTLSCVSNQIGGNLVGNAIWTGVPLRTVLNRAGVQSAATQIVGRSVDNWNSGFPTQAAYDGRVALVAVAMNGEPLPRDHGFPVRLVVAGLYGYVSATKWLEEIRLTTWEGFDSYWVPRGWAKEGPIKTQSRVDVPRNGARVNAGRVAVAGVAWAPSRSIERVEVQVDNRAWVPAELSLNMSINSWRQWLYAWDATPGRHRIRVRATDGTGRTQTERRTPPAPNGASGWHTINVTVV